jgi:hypothetical protein
LLEHAELALFAHHHLLIEVAFHDFPMDLGNLSHRCGDRPAHPEGDKRHHHREEKENDQGHSCGTDRGVAGLG